MASRQEVAKRPAEEPSREPPKSPVAPRVLTAQDRKRLRREKQLRERPLSHPDSNKGGKSSSRSNAGVKRRRKPASDAIDEDQEAKSRSLFDDVDTCNDTRVKIGRQGVGGAGRSSSNKAKTSLFGAVMQNTGGNGSGAQSGDRPTSSGSASSKATCTEGGDGIGSSESTAEHSVDLLADVRVGVVATDVSNKPSKDVRVVPQTIAPAGTSDTGASTSRGSRSDCSDTVEATRFGEYDASSNEPTITGASIAEKMTTPTKSRGAGGLFSNIPSKSAASPGGYGMMDTIMDMFDGSPYKGRKDGDDEEKIHGEEKKDADDEEDDDDKDDGGVWKMASLRLPRWLSRGLFDDADEGEDGDLSASARDTGDARKCTTVDSINNTIKQESLEEVSAFDMPTQPAPRQDESVAFSPPQPDRAELGLTLKRTNVSESTDDEPGLNVGIIDWSLKRRLRMECHPGRALPGGLMDAPGLGPDVDGLAMNILLNGRCSDSINMDELSTGDKRKSEEAIIAARWKAAQMYWRHPAVYPLPKEFLGVDSHPTASSSRKRRNSLNQDYSMGPPPPRRAAAKSLSFASTTGVRGTDEAEAAAIRAEATKVYERRTSSIRSMGFGSSSTAAPSILALMDNPAEIIRQREAEWMEAFRSLYYAWMEKIDSLRLSMDNQLPSSRILDGLARTYFYVVSPARTVLFRCKLSSFETDNADMMIEPMVVISSTSAELRSKLREMNVTIHILHRDKSAEPNDAEGAVFHESVFEAKTESKLSKHEEDEAKKVHDELEALRRATAHGHTAGAEITVSMKKQKSKIEEEVKDDQICRPLYVKGDEDCTAFYEFLLNTKGKLDLTSVSSSPKSDVPLLIHREFGPTANCSLDTLSVVARRDDNYWGLKAMKEQESKTVHEAVHSSIQLEGPILPCAVRDLLHSSICRLMLDKVRQNDCVDTGEDSPMELVGSHYLVWTATRQEAQEGSTAGASAEAKPGRAKKAAKRMAYYMKETGEASSSLFNSGLDRWREKEQDYNGSGQEGDIGSCGPRRVLQMMIWNVDNPRNVSYTTDVVPSTPTS
mmetsp:Transcript_7194/g.15692  ORF Transcript_7194/g.15692 Transcript_7194/m.15692 type:complete len:1058 (-) Transcript_7194:1645-4818(-)